MVFVLTVWKRQKPKLWTDKSGDKRRESQATRFSDICVLNYNNCSRVSKLGKVLLNLLKYPQPILIIVY